VHRDHLALGDRREDEDGVRDARDRHVGGVARRAHHLGLAVDAVDGIAAELHAAPRVLASARTMVRRASSTLNWLCRRGLAPASPAWAAWEKPGSVGAFPTRCFSASTARQGLVPTPPSASRAPRIFPPSMRSAAAAATSAKAYDARSRILKYRPCR